jgi:hypothetical protein
LISTALQYNTTLPQEMVGVEYQNVNRKYCNSALTPQEEECCVNSVSMSAHTQLVVMPNHGLNGDGELQGFLFMAHPDDRASVLPINKRMCETTSMYECKSVQGSDVTPFNPTVLHIVNNLQSYRDALQEYIASISQCATQDAAFDCIPERQTITTEFETEDVLDLHIAHLCDAREWSVSVPNKVGLYHAYSNTSQNPFIEHKLFIVVSGYLPRAAEEMHNLWLDCKDSISCQDFVQSEELNWLRRATQRNHNRIAAELADIFNLHFDTMQDADSVSANRGHILPSTTTIQSDAVFCPQSNRIKMTDDACLPESSNNGIVFEMYSCEGFWLFHGPRDNATYNPYGGEFYCTGVEAAFPTRTRMLQGMFSSALHTDVIAIPRASNGSTIFARSPVQASSRRRPAEGEVAEGVEGEVEEGAPADRNAQTQIDETEEDTDARTHIHINKFIQPSENFMRVLQTLGFNRNDGITNLMPLVCYVQNE